MTYDMLVKILDQAESDKCVIGFMFGSGYKFIYRNNEPFDRNIHLNKALNCVMMHSEDCREKPFTVYGIIDDITHIYIATDPGKGPIDVPTSIMM